jgi:hypothetical protein
MFRFLSGIVVCALPLVMTSPAAAQSYISVTGETEIAAPAPLGPPVSIMQRYVPSAPSPTRDMSLLVGDTQPATPAPVAAISVTSPVTPAPMARVAVNDLGIGRSTIVVSNVRGLNE